MDNQLEEHARKLIIEGLNKLPESYRNFFKRIYSYTDKTADINDIVDGLHSSTLNDALTLVKRSLTKLNIR